MFEENIQLRLWCEINSDHDYCSVLKLHAINKFNENMLHLQ